MGNSAMQTRRRALHTKILTSLEIMEALPHRGRMLFLDRVLVYPKDYVRGEFEVKPENCEGHAVDKGNMVLRGVDMIEMAAQTLGVYWSVIRPEFKGRTVLFRSVEKAKFRGIVHVSEEIAATVVLADILEKISERRGTGELIGRNISIVSSQKEVARIGAITLVLLPN